MLETSPAPRLDHLCHRLLYLCPCPSLLCLCPCLCWSVPIGLALCLGSSLLCSGSGRSTGHRLYSCTSACRGPFLCSSRRSLLQLFLCLGLGASDIACVDVQGLSNCDTREEVEAGHHSSCPCSCPCPCQRHQVHCHLRHKSMLPQLAAPRRRRQEASRESTRAARPRDQQQTRAKDLQLAATGRAQEVHQELELGCQRHRPYHPDLFPMVYVWSTSST